MGSKAEEKRGSSILRGSVLPGHLGRQLQKRGYERANGNRVVGGAVSKHRILRGDRKVLVKKLRPKTVEGDL